MFSTKTATSNRAHSPAPAEFMGRALGVTICEDLWRTVGELHVRYHFDPVPALADLGVDVLLNLSASPFSLGKLKTRRALIQDIAKRHALPLVYVNQVGGNDDLIFDGGSMVVNARGEIVAMAKQFEEDLLVVDLDALPPVHRERGHGAH